jgi:putative membrane protein
MQMRHLLITATIIGTLAATPVLAKVTAEDFVHKASIANEFEIETSKLALDKSSNDDVKEVAQHMIDDHEKTGKKLEETLKSSHTDLTPETQLDSKHQELYDSLKSASAEDFDNKYAKIQTDAHNEAIKLFSTYSKKGDNSALRGFAAKTLPALQKHLKRVTQLNLSK